MKTMQIKLKTIKKDNEFTPILIELPIYQNNMFQPDGSKMKNCGLLS